MLKGIGASSGIGIGKIWIKKQQEMKIQRVKIQDCAPEIERLYEAVGKSKNQIANLYEQTVTQVGEEEAKIFEAHLMMVEDEAFLEEIENIISTEGINAEAALNHVANKHIDMFRQLDDEYLRERAIDLEDVSGRVLKNLLGLNVEEGTELREPSIVIAYDLTPSDTAMLDKSKVLGFVTELGGKTSHTAIMARTLQIPAVVGVDQLLDTVSEGDMMAIDGELGEVVINPSKEILSEYEHKKLKWIEEETIYKEYIHKETRTKDDKKLICAANIGTPEDVYAVLENGADGIGLFRTEFLYLHKDKSPSENEQFIAYKNVAEALNGKSIIIRTLDIGGDKEVPYLNLPKEENPFLGYRAIRFCLDNEAIFKTQLRAILRASYFGNIKIMFPMISCMAELKKAKELLEEAKQSLKSENIAYNKDIQVGIMIEIPSAAICSDQFAKEVDFFSIGANDLIQYTVAVDRGNRSIAKLYSEYNPGVLRLIHQVIQNAHNEGIWVGMCGEAASNEKLTALLIAMGLDEFSMSASCIPKLRWLMSQLSTSDCQQVLNVLECSNGYHIEEQLTNYLELIKTNKED